MFIFLSFNKAVGRLLTFRTPALQYNVAKQKLESWIETEEFKTDSFS